MLVAHYLGVDHVGHSFHVRHPEMDRKLTDYARVVRRTADILSADSEHADTLLLVFGDHGEGFRCRMRERNRRKSSTVCIALAVDM